MMFKMSDGAIASSDALASRGRAAIRLLPRSI